jgi:UDP-glucose 4-epimerase
VTGGAVAGWGLGRRVLVTGGAGFIAHDLIVDLVGAGHEVTIFDNLATAEPDWVEALEARLGPARWRAGARVALGDVRDLRQVEVACEGQDAVVHLASSTDIPGGAADPRLDFEGCLVGTWNVLEGMRRRGVGRLLYSSSGVVYGGLAAGPSREDSGPLRPESHYAAAKLAAESLISGFAHLYGWKATVFRFGNTIGSRASHGVVHDFVVKLLRDPERLEILGDGRQAKPFIAVDDLVEAMRVASRAAATERVATYNVATAPPVPIAEVAQLVARAVGIDARGLCLELGGQAGGWPGDTRLVDLDPEALHGLGWRPARDGRAAVEWAARGIAARYRQSGAPLLTAIERRSLAQPRARTARPSLAGLPAGPS